MRISKFSDQEIAMILKQTEAGQSVKEVCERAGITPQTYYRWRRHYQQDEPPQPTDKRVRQLEDENRRLKEIVADLSLDKATLQDALHKKFASPALQVRPVIGRADDV